MSEENVPRLRLKPKLAADPAVSTTPVPPTEPAPSSADAPSASPAKPAPLVPPATPEAPKFVRLKPRLSATPPPEPVLGTVPAEVPPAPEYVPPAEPAAQAPMSTPSPAETPADKPVTKFSFRPKAAAGAPPPPARSLSTAPLTPPPGPKVEPLVLSAPAAPGAAAVDAGEDGEPAEITAIRTASASPFPPPTGKFPPPTAGKLSEGKSKSGGSAKKLAIYGLLAVVVLGGGFYAYTTFMAEEPPPPPAKPKLAANPTTSQGQAVAKAQALVDQAKQQVNESVNEIMPDAPAATTTASSPATGAPVEATAPTPAVVTPPPAPLASVQFKAWVENLRISGVRAGASTKVFIGGTAYSVGDLVNPQLGIVFDGYNADTRMLTFKDKSGATVDRRN